jgi:hypothetical protein
VFAVHHPAGKMLYPHALHLNDWNDVILHFLQVPLACAFPPHLFVVADTTI